MVWGGERHVFTKQTASGHEVGEDPNNNSLEYSE